MFRLTVEYETRKMNKTRWNKTRWDKTRETRQDKRQDKTKQDDTREKREKMIARWGSSDGNMDMTRLIDREKGLSSSCL